MSDVISSSDIEILKRDIQMANIRVAFTPPYNPYFYKGYTAADFHQQIDWGVVPILGCNRLAFLGDTIDFDGIDSYTYGLGSYTTRNFTFYVDGVQKQDGWLWSYNHTCDTVGTFLITMVVDIDGKVNVARRWFVVIDYEADTSPIASVESISGSITNGGWQASIKLSQMLDTVKVDDYQGVIIYCYDMWGVAYEGKLYSEYGTIYRDRAENNILLNGYVVNGSINRDLNTASASFVVRTPEFFLQQCIVTAHDYWHEEAAGVGYWLAGLCPQDVMRHLLVEGEYSEVTQPSNNFMDDPDHGGFLQTDFGMWHDVFIYNKNLGVNLNYTPRLTINEGPIWSGLQELAKNEYCWLYCDQFGGLHFTPDLTVCPSWFWTDEDTNLAPVMCFDDDLMFKIDISEQPTTRVKLVQLNATTSEDEAIKSEYPPYAGRSIGAWEIQNSILTDNQEWLDGMAIAAYYQLNNRYTAKIVTGMNHALDIGDIITIRHNTDPTGQYRIDTGNWRIGVSELDTETRLA